MSRHVALLVILCIVAVTANDEKGEKSTENPQFSTIKPKSAHEEAKDFLEKMMKNLSPKVLLDPLPSSFTTHNHVTNSSKTYYFSSGIHLSWHDAGIFCCNHGLQLAIIHNKEENDFIFNIKNNTISEGHDIWLGASDDTQEDTWRWSVTEKELTYHNWGEELPDGSTDENCLVMDSDGEWDDVECFRPLPFVCEKINPKVEHPVAGIVKKKTYLSKTDRRSWHHANLFCCYHGLQLPVISSEEKNTKIFEMKNSTNQTDSWLGATDEIEEGAWKWLSGIDVASEGPNSKWGPNQPAGGRGENCMAMSFDGNWYDVRCDYYNAFMCEKK